MKRLFVFMLLVMLTGITIEAQVAPPAGHLDSCQANLIQFELFGPHCLNPVLWDDAGIIPVQDIVIGDTVLFFREDGSSDVGVMQGYWWDFVHERYVYYVMVAPAYAGISAEFAHVAPGWILP